MRTIGTHRIIGSIKIQLWSWFNIPLKRINYSLVPYVNNNETKLGSMTHYPLHAYSPWTDVCKLTRKCYHLSRLPLQSLSYKSHFLCNQLIYSSSKEHMSNSTKGIIVVIDFIIACPLDHPRGHTISIS